MVKTAIQSKVVPLRWDERFIDNYAGNLIEDPRVAIIELIANSWDAGAMNVDIRWPDEIGGTFTITDDGTGMTGNEFKKIWATIDYNRVKNQGESVRFPPDVTPTSRPAYGRNGRGRHALFCFSTQYEVETWRDNSAAAFAVRRSAGTNPIEITFRHSEQKSGHGTTVSCKLEANYLPQDEVRNLIGLKFITDPSFTLRLNNKLIPLSDFKDASETGTIDLPDGNKLEVLQVESPPGKKSYMQGIAWWVGGRLVGEPSWDTILDGRTRPSRIYTFIVKADSLIEEVKNDWTGFRETQVVREARALVNDFVLTSIGDFQKDIRLSNKILAIQDNKSILKELPDLSRERIGAFIDNMQKQRPRVVSSEFLSDAIKAFANLEMARSGWDLMKKLAFLSEDDISGLDELLDKWSIAEAKIILDELERRLYIVTEMEKLIVDPNTKELSELQPLFENALWVFGSEYDGREYFSDRPLLKSLEVKSTNKEWTKNLNRRPDFLILSDHEGVDSTLGVYTNTKYDDDGEDQGIDKALIVELKGGGSRIGVKWRRQGEDYALIIRQSGKISPTSIIRCYVLGSSVDPSVGATEAREPELIEVIPKTFSDVLKMAHAKTFNLIEKIKKAKGIKIGDQEINHVLGQKEIEDFPSKIES